MEAAPDRPLPFRWPLDHSSVLNSRLIKMLIAWKPVQRPAVSLLDRAPLAGCCTFLSYDSLLEISKLSHMGHLADTVLEDYTKEAD